MKRKQIREEAKLYFIPFLLGDNSTSHILSLKIFKKYHIKSLILDKTRRLSDIFDLSSKFTQIADTKHHAITVMQLKDLAAQTQYTLPLLIPCTSEYEELVSEYRAELESEFIILSADFSFENSPLSVIPN